MSWDSSDEEDFDIFSPDKTEKVDKLKYYKQGKRIGEGGQAEVFEGIDPSTGQPIAIKKFNLSNIGNGVNIFSIREIMLMQEISLIKPSNIVQIVDVFSYKYRICIVYEFCPRDLRSVIQNRDIILSKSDIKAMIRMVLNGLVVVHGNYILHRDIKPENILIGLNGELKLSDFGLGRKYGSPDCYLTPQATTIPPELFMGSSKYGASADIWGVGCIFAELLTRSVLFLGNSEISILGSIFNVLGTPTEKSWPLAKSLPNFMEFTPCEPMNFTDIFPAASNVEIDFLKSLLSLDPLKRPSAKEALEHPYFAELPEPTPINKLPYISYITRIFQINLASTTPNSSFNSSSTNQSSVKRQNDISYSMSPVLRKKLKFIL